MGRLQKPSLCVCVCKLKRPSHHSVAIVSTRCNERMYKCRYGLNVKGSLNTTILCGANRSILFLCIVQQPGCSGGSRRSWCSPAANPSHVGRYFGVVSQLSARSTVVARPTFPVRAAEIPRARRPADVVRPSHSAVRRRWQIVDKSRHTSQRSADRKRMYLFSAFVRSTSKSRPNNIRGGKNVHPSVRPSVHKKFLRFQWNLVYR